MIKKTGYTIFFIFSVIASQTASAYSIGIDWTGGGSTGSSSQTGWAISPSASINITDLGWYDDGLDGLNASHQIGIWDTGGTLLISGTGASGMTDPLLGKFRYTSSLTGALTLSAGSYVIGGFAADDTSFRLWFFKQKES
ncbi:MAG: hypothetical protein WAW36_07100 [Methylovulum miyakonense]|uniref:hypothetical protein n=1 Tax=Methylovulum miyakonense TaxID=645578 RepID=UPI003BB802A7